MYSKHLMKASQCLYCSLRENTCKAVLMLWFALAHDGFDSTVSWSKTPSQVRNLVGTGVKHNRNFANPSCTERVV